MADLGRIIDVHSQAILPGPRGTTVGAGYVTSDWAPEGALAHMDEHGIAACVLSLPDAANHAIGREARDFARPVNERLAAIVSAYPGRFGALATPPGRDPESCLEEISYALDVLGLDGVAISTSVGGMYLAAAPRAPSGAPAKVAATMPARASASTLGRVQLTFLTPIDSKYEIAPSEGPGPPEPTALPLTFGGSEKVTGDFAEYVTSPRSGSSGHPAAVVEADRLGFGKEGADRFGDAALAGASNVDRHDRPGALRILGWVALAHGKGGSRARRHRRRSLHRNRLRWARRQSVAVYEGLCQLRTEMGAAPLGGNSSRRNERMSHVIGPFNMLLQRCF